MMNRRRALLAIGAAALGGVGQARAAIGRLLQPFSLGVQAVASNEAVDDRLRQDLARLAPRANSEVGVPVFLACMNLVVHQGSQKVALTPLNREVAAEFRRDAAAWERIRPNAPGSDVAKLIEVLADRHFTTVGKEQMS